MNATCQTTATNYKFTIKLCKTTKSQQEQHDLYILLFWSSKCSFQMSIDQWSIEGSWVESCVEKRIETERQVLAGFVTEWKSGHM